MESEVFKTTRYLKKFDNSIIIRKRQKYSLQRGEDLKNFKSIKDLAKHIANETNFTYPSNNRKKTVELNLEGGIAYIFRPLNEKEENTLVKKIIKYSK